VLRAVRQLLHRFAGEHVRNVATLAGNLATASPISDLNPVWMASGARVRVFEKKIRNFFKVT
jgi:xanthine dehydrogenase/oxidase